MTGDGLDYEHADKSCPIVCFGSFQDFLGKNEAGGIKPRNEWVHAANWDLVIFDEYHFGAWRDSARELFEEEDKREQNDNMNSVAKLIEESFQQGDTDFLPITTGAYLFLSGTPFRAIVNGGFIEEQIFNWTYSDEQRAKERWKAKDGRNPYESLPRMVLMTYQMSDQIREIASAGEFDEFDLNEFFAAKGEGDVAEFKHRDEVQKWLDLLRGGFSETTVDMLKMGARKAAHAVLRFPVEEHPDARVLVHAVRRVPLCDGEPVEGTAERVLPRLHGERVRRCRRGYRVGCAWSGATVDGGSVGIQDHHPVVWQTDHGRDRQAVDRDLHAAQPEKSGNVFSSGVPRAVAMDSGQPRRPTPQRDRDHETRMLRVRFRADSRAVADRRLQLLAAS